MPRVLQARAIRRLDRGSALVIVLLFVVLLTALTIAFLSRSLTARRVATSSAGETKAALLANSASDIVIGDLRQEIIAGSSKGTGWTANWPYYTPNSNATMIPFLNGTPASSATIPNLISRSVSSSNTGGTNPYRAYPTSSALYTAGSVPPARAATDPSAASSYTSSKVNSAYPSLNGRYISLAQWNAPYLMSSAQLNSFVPPDWVIVTRAGASAVSWNGSTGGLTDATIANNNYAIGRYAYAIYNEGGTLDMNAAGYPSGLSATQVSNKSSLALADLTQVGLTQAQVDNIIGWRNYASAKLTGAYGSFSPFTSTSANNWLTNFAMGNTNGNMQVTPPPTGFTTPPTDQAFISRQQLISLAQSLSINTDLLQYLGTFTRSLDQPSVVPDPNRPRILSSGTPPPPAGGSPGDNEDNYLGNNDAAGGDDTINPQFLSIRVTTPFNRLNGTPAVVGEPLVKTKFALSRLALVTYSSTANATAGDQIYDRFGISRSSASSPWTYNHGITDPTTGEPIIGTLAKVATAGREPDFAELLKAALTAGSLAKGGPNLNYPGYNNYQYTLDSTLDYQVLQVMANMIDQYDTDSYPTVIQIQVNPSTGSPYYRSFAGVEDLPYFYRYHIFSVVDRLPVTSLGGKPISQSSSVTFPAPSPTNSFTSTASTSTATTGLGGSTVSASWDVTPGSVAITVPGMAAGTLSDQGEATYMYVLDLWNPHDMNTLVATSNLQRPTQFRVYASTDDPVGITPQWKIGAETVFQGSTTVTPVTVPGTSGSVYFAPTSTQTALTVTNSALTFSDNSGKLFREPTLLWGNPLGAQGPTGIALSGVGSVTEATGTGKTYYGIIAGKAPIAQQINIASSPSQSTDGNYIVQGASITTTTAIPASGYQELTFFLQYLDANGNWVTYDTKFPDFHGMVDPHLVVNTADFPNNTYMNPLLNNQVSDHASTRDPRTARWGVGTEIQQGEISSGTYADGSAYGSANPYLLEAASNLNFNNAFYGTPSTQGPANNALRVLDFSVLETARARADKGDQINYSNPGMTSNPGKNLQMRIFSGVGFSASNGQTTSPVEFDGLLSQNNPAISYNARDNSTGNQHFYFEDADGVARRAMGAYADISLTDASTVSTGQSIATTPHRIGLPMATAYTFNNNATPTALAQTQSRPIILNRPFKSVSEMSYCFTGTPWKNIDFSIPESGSTALLDVFCLNEPPANAMVAGKIDLNTRQPLVLQSLLAGSYRDEFNNIAAPPSYALPPLSATEAANVAGVLVGITTDTTHAWRGPLQNISGLVGRFIATPGSTSGFSDFYTYAPPSPVSGQSSSITYAGLSAALDSTVYTNTSNSASTSAPIIERFREAAIRPLAAAGQVRVWNLLIDIVAQTGKYPPTATGFDQFMVEGQKRVWLHVAIDRYTGQILDKQVEVVTP